MAIIEYLREVFGGKDFVRFFLAVAWSAFAMWVLKYLLTNNLSGSMKEFGNTVLGFVLGTIIGTVINFYFGSSKSSSDKDEVIKEATKE